jgi:hypothetical protein
MRGSFSIPLSSTANLGPWIALSHMHSASAVRVLQLVLSTSFFRAPYVSTLREAGPLRDSEHRPWGSLVSSIYASRVPFANKENGSFVHCVEIRVPECRQLPLAVPACPLLKKCCAQRSNSEGVAISLAPNELTRGMFIRVRGRCPPQKFNGCLRVPHFDVLPLQSVP